MLCYCWMGAFHVLGLHCLLANELLQVAMFNIEGAATTHGLCQHSHVLR